MADYERLTYVTTRLKAAREATNNLAVANALDEVAKWLTEPMTGPTNPHQWRSDDHLCFECGEGLSHPNHLSAESGKERRR